MKWAVTVMKRATAAKIIGFFNIDPFLPPPKARVRLQLDRIYAEVKQSTKKTP
ncbi:hypothetical protein SERLADRAFT_403653 [Serpula lacrymans var. lacrymans S7.9]|uniref:Uncharacterized protein n=1 Tax=Serpula lacrymans var. lacrymans (strain S7.9) TaxID=578457 RepID=F8PDQ1_SERL9|nr:uncharacterized protein SERLADRAFT_403653 [Serpula lacrymans var. lacrymans S7.9]EGO18871.1 hypothetical protein SERLADRAFT_403653 [Serpula lacrymans var. lacrymans S7.9]